MTKQTAVEWLLEQISVKNGFIIFSPSNIDQDGLTEIFDQAKAMEKEQIINAWMVIDNQLQRLAAEQYYTIRYGGDK